MRRNRIMDDSSNSIIRQIFLQLIAFGRADRKYMPDMCIAFADLRKNDFRILDLCKITHCHLLTFCIVRIQMWQLHTQHRRLNLIQATVIALV